MATVVRVETWTCPNHSRCGAWAYLKYYDCGCMRVEWQDRGTYDPKRCAPNPRDINGPNYPRCGA
jgi:uncharacterized protein YukJ